MEGKHQDLKYISPEMVTGGGGGGQPHRPPPLSSAPSLPRGDPHVVLPQMVAVLSGHFSSAIESCVIVDCRYPYEYEGGHIKVRTAGGERPKPGAALGASRGGSGAG